MRTSEKMEEKRRVSTTRRKGREEEEVARRVRPKGNENLPSHVHNDRKQLVQPIRILRIVTRVEKPKLEGEGDSVVELDVTSEFLLVLESLEVESEHVGESFDLHPV